MNIERDFGDLADETFGYSVSSDIEFYTYEEAAEKYANQFKERITHLESNNEDLKYYYNLLLEDYATIISAEGYADRSKTIDIWRSKIKNF